MDVLRQVWVQQYWYDDTSSTVVMSPQRPFTGLRRTWDYHHRASSGGPQRYRASRLQQERLPHQLGRPDRHLSTRDDQPTLEADEGRPQTAAVGPVSTIRLPQLPGTAAVHRQRRRQRPSHPAITPAAAGDPNPGTSRTADPGMEEALRHARRRRSHRLRDRRRLRVTPLPIPRTGRDPRPARPHRRRHQHHPTEPTRRQRRPPSHLQRLSRILSHDRDTKITSGTRNLCQNQSSVAADIHAHMRPPCWP